MGGSVSTVEKLPIDSATSDKEAMERMISLLRPVYYTTEPLTAEEASAAKKAWNMIVGNQCQNFFDFKALHPERPCRTAHQYLHTCFFERLFTVHPSCRSLFQRIPSKMNIVPIISSVVSKLDTRSEQNQALVNLVAVHNKIGVKAVEYGIAGECLMHAIQSVIGLKEFTAATNRGWCKIYSMMLDVMIPEAVRFEIENAAAAKKINEQRYLLAREIVVQTGNARNETNIAMRINGTLATQPSTSEVRNAESSSTVVM